MWLFAAALLSSTPVAANTDFTAEGPAPGNLRFTWIHGSRSAKANTDVRVQVHRYNEHTYILHQNPAVHWEAPFMYLLLGNRRAVLLDTGATREAEYFPLRATVDAVLERWLQANGADDIELIVMPLGTALSQLEGMDQFADRPRTRIIEPQGSQRGNLLGAAWPEKGTLDLGGRQLTVMPTPGLDEHAVTVYDPFTQILFTGNSFYPGRLVVRDFEAYRTSIAHLSTFAASTPIRWVMGGRIEMTSHPGMDYLLRANYRPNEHQLQLKPALLGQCFEVLQLINGREDIRILDDYIVMHGVGRGARDYGWPVFTPEQFRKPNTR